MDDAVVDRLDVTCVRLPTDSPESDSTACWDQTTMIVVEARAADTVGLGYSYGHAAAGRVVTDTLAGVVIGTPACAPVRSWQAMLVAVRNLGRAGIAASAIAAVDVALWDLHARRCGRALVELLGDAHERVAAYGSGGFTSLDDAELQRQLAGFVEQGTRMVKMKVGREPRRDPIRVAAARAAIGDGVELFVDANGAYAVAQAIERSARFAEHDVRWHEEPVSSDDLPGLRALRDHAPPGMAIAAGEYGYDAAYFERMLAAQAVDVLQADATRCLGVTGFMQAAALCVAHGRPLSAHCAPALHTHLACAAPTAVHVELFFDHQRMERL
jgi:L-alanine-DL-glutamate epimerase-like enolase superfamily enzyme